MEKIKKLIEEDLCTHITSTSDRLKEDLKGDSLDIMSLCLDLEREFNIVIPDDDIVKLVTVQDVIDYVNEHADYLML